jgi:arginase
MVDMRNSTVAILGAPLDMGAGRRGVDMGPSALRVANLNGRIAALGYEVRDLGNVEVDQQEELEPGPKNARYLPHIAATCARLARKVEKAAADGALPVVLGGDHSIAVGTVGGMARCYRKRKQRIGLIWIDAHADMNTPASSPSGNVHGMPLACIAGMGPKELTHLAGVAPMVDPDRIVLVGIRDVDLTESPNVRKAGVNWFTMRDIDERGMRAVMEDAVRIASTGTAGFHVSFDMDSLDPDEAPGVGTPVRGGITYREAHLAMEIIADSGKMTSLEIVEVNPVIDVANRTALLGVELALSALGKRIL